MIVFRLILILSVFFSCRVAGSVALAQEEASEGVYLDEPQPEPPPQVAQRRKVQAKYPDGTIRMEREIALMSDNSFVNDGSYIEYYEDGTKFAEGNFTEGIMDGDWKYWHPNGQLCKDITYKAGKPDGSHKVFREDGTVESVQVFKDGVRNGEWISYFEDGETVKMKTEFDTGRLSGQRITYYRDGSVRQQAEFSDGLLDGQTTEFGKDGKKLAEAVFEKGKVKSIKRFQ